MVTPGCVPQELNPYFVIGSMLMFASLHVVSLKVTLFRNASPTLREADLYRNFVTPHVEFSVQVWSPHLNNDITTERVQQSDWFHSWSS